MPFFILSGDAVADRTRYACEHCHKQCQEPMGSVLSLLALCTDCQAKRYAKGLAEQRRVLAAQGGAS